MSNERVLAVGERHNIGRDWKPTRPGFEYSFTLRLGLGFYNQGPRRKFLNELGVTWDDGINLLWPSKQVGAWDAEHARRVVDKIRSYVEDYQTALLFGRRVCDAFDVEFDVLKRQGIYVPMPHPSGKNFMWNDVELLNKIRKYFKTKGYQPARQVR